MRSQHPELARPEKRCLDALATVSWPCVAACGSLEPPRRDGENAQTTRENGEKLGEIRSKRCRDYLGTLTDVESLPRTVARNATATADPPLFTYLWSEMTPLFTAGHLKIPKGVTVVHADAGDG